MPAIYRQLLLNEAARLTNILGRYISLSIFDSLINVSYLRTTTIHHIFAILSTFLALHLRYHLALSYEMGAFVYALICITGTLINYGDYGLIITTTVYVTASMAEMLVLYDFLVRAGHGPFSGQARD